MVRLLTRLFLRRFLDNDLVSPGGDTHLGPVHALAGVGVASLMVFVTVTLKYSQFRLPWEEVADRSFDDAAFYVAASMIVFGLAATLAWDAFYLDSRDRFVLGSLPVPSQVLSLAKLSALCVFLIALTVAANFVPVLFAPALMLRPVREATFAHWSMLTRAHATASIVAGVWTALTIVAFRGLLGHLLPDRLFRRVSPLIQGCLVLVLLGWFVLLPQFLRTASQVWMAGGWQRDASPAFWFLGLHRVIIGRPLDVAGRGPDPACAALAHVALLALATALVVVVILYLVWPPRVQFVSDTGPARGRRALLPASLVDPLFTARSVERATFEFVLAGFLRSGVHRMYLAAAVGTGLAWSVGGFVAFHAPTTWSLHVQFVLILFTLAAVRLGVAMPISLNANWAFRIAERQPASRYRYGTCLAAFTISAWPIVALAPFQWWFWGARVAMYHSTVGACYAACAVLLLFGSWNAIPFATSFVSGSLRLKTRWPLYLFGPTVLAVGPAFLEHLLLQRGWLAALTPVALAALAVAALVHAGVRDRERQGLVFDQLPIDSFQTLAILEP